MLSPPKEWKHPKRKGDPMTTKAHRKRKPLDHQTMGKAEYAAARVWLNLGHQEFAKLVGISTRQDQYFRAGQCEIPATLTKLIRTIIDHKLKPDEVGRLWPRSGAG
jgi:DNA-binding transcriptional regulator YiaG